MKKIVPDPSTSLCNIIPQTISLSSDGLLVVNATEKKWLLLKNKVRKTFF